MKVKDFFISYNKNDQQWAEWIAFQLEKVGYEVVIQAWDFRPGGNFVLEMQKAAVNTRQTIAVLSEYYLEAEFTQPEWASRFAEDPRGEKRTLIPIRVSECQPPGMLATQIYAELVGLSEDAARTALLGALEERAKPEQSPPFPGVTTTTTSPPFPGNAPKSPKPLIHNLPFRDIGSLFKGRDDALQQLDDNLYTTAGHATAIVAAQSIHGLGGVGKTRLAVEYAWRHAEQYSALLFVKADTPENLQADLAALCETLRLPQQEILDQVVRVHAVENWLTENAGWLLILDNIDDKHAAIAVQDFVAKINAGKILITGRWTRFGDQIKTMSLGILGESAAAAYLLEKTQAERRLTENDQAGALELAQRLNCLAVALEHAAAYVITNRCSLAEYLQAWQENFTATASWYDQLTLSYPHSVLATWVMTMGKVSVAARELLETLSWLSTEPIPSFLISANQRAVANELADYSMLKWDREADTWEMHRVVQEVTRSRIASENCPISVKAALQMVKTAAPNDSGDVRTWNIWDQLRPHVTAVVDHADRLHVYQPTTSLMGSLGILLSAKALHSDAEQFERRALEIDTVAHGEESSQVAIRLNNLAQTLQATNRLSEAEPLMRRALVIDEQAFGKDHPNVAIRLNNLAQLLQATNRLSEAEPLMRRALAIFAMSLVENHPNTITVKENYRLLLTKMKLPKTEIKRRIQSALAGQGTPGTV